MGYIERSFGRGNLWTLFFGLGFIIWGIVAVRYPNTPGSYWMFIPGGILLIAAISNIFTYRYNREKVLGALKSYQRVDMNHLSNELRMKIRDLKEIIVDLRAEGKLKASFDPESGEVVVFEVKGMQPSGGTTVTSPPPAEVNASKKYEEMKEVEITPVMQNIKDQGYCPYCGSKVSDKDKFCVTCGSALM